MSTHRHGPEGHHDWHSQEYVDHWIDHDLTRDDERRPVLRDMMQHAPFPADAAVEVLDIGAGYGIVSEEALKAFPNARVTLLDYSAPMLAHAGRRLSAYADRIELLKADLSTPDWTDGLRHRFDLAISGLALHNLANERHFQDMYKETLQRTAGRRRVPRLRPRELHRRPRRPPAVVARRRLRHGNEPVERRHARSPRRDDAERLAAVRLLPQALALHLQVLGDGHVGLVTGLDCVGARPPSASRSTTVSAIALAALSTALSQSSMR